MQQFELKRQIHQNVHLLGIHLFVRTKYEMYHMYETNCRLSVPVLGWVNFIRPTVYRCKLPSFLLAGHLTHFFCVLFPTAHAPRKKSRLLAAALIFTMALGTQR